MSTHMKKNLSILIVFISLISLLIYKTIIRFQEANTSQQEEMTIGIIDGTVKLCPLALYILTVLYLCNITTKKLKDPINDLINIIGYIGVIGAFFWVYYLTKNMNTEIHSLEYNNGFSFIFGVIFFSGLFIPLLVAKPKKLSNIEQNQKL